MTTMQFTERSEEMSMDDWRVTTVFLTHWQTGVFGYELVGVYPDRTSADDAVRRHSTKGHGGAKCEPTEQIECVVPNRAFVCGDQFMPYGSWFDNAARNLVFARNGKDEPNFRLLIFTFGDAPHPDIGT